MNAHWQKIGISVSTVAAFISHAPWAGAQALPTVNVTVDATGAGTPLKRIWDFYGYDEDNYTTTPAGQALLKTLGTIDPTPPHIRTHFLLNSSGGTPTFKWGWTNAYTADASGNAIYDWTLMDGIMDTITGAGTLPFVEIGFMPHDLSVRPDPYQNSGVYTLDGGCFYPPKDYVKWGALIQEWAKHSNARYQNVASTWQWELWNEPNIGYWHGTAAEYDKLYDYTEAALHQVLPTAPLGGPATAGVGGPFLTQFLAHCATGTNAVTGTTGTHLDMVTFHAKGGVTIVGGHVQMNLGNQLAQHSNGFNIVAGFPQFKQTPIVVSEADPDGCAGCPVSTNPQDAYRNSPAYGAYEVAMMKKTLDLEASLGVNVRGLLTWAFLFNNQPYFAGYRVLSSNGIHLPVLNAFKLLGGLSGNRVPVTSSGALTAAQIIAASVRQQADVDAMATVNGQGVQVLVWNYHDELVTAPASPVHLSVRVPASFGPRLVVSHLRADDTHGDAYNIWVSQGSPATPSAAQIAQMQQGMQPSELQPPQAVAVVGGAASIDFDLPRFGISLISLSPVGLSDASVADSAPASSGDGATAPVVDGASGSGAPGTDGAGASGSGAPSSSGDDAAAAATDGSGGSGGSSGTDSGSNVTGGGAGAAAPHTGGCNCGVAGGRRSMRIPDETLFVLATGLPIAGVVYRRRRSRSRR
ncbi:MAG: beta-xylosidase [Myxococcota bacterium]|nr:beta-xylosidase [Myxococcota bacterium]